MTLLLEMIKTQGIEHVLHKIKNEKRCNIPPVQNLNLQDTATKKVTPLKLPKFEISKFNGIILNWQGFCDQFNLVVQTKTNFGC